jgi:hypothetical protein
VSTCDCENRVPFTSSSFHPDVNQTNPSAVDQDSGRRSKGSAAAADREDELPASARQIPRARFISHEFPPKKSLLFPPNSANWHRCSVPSIDRSDLNRVSAFPMLGQGLIWVCCSVAACRVFAGVPAAVGARRAAGPVLPAAAAAAAASGVPGVLQPGAAAAAILLSAAAWWPPPPQPRPPPP